MLFSEDFWDSDSMRRRFVRPSDCRRFHRPDMLENFVVCVASCGVGPPAGLLSSSSERSRRHRLCGARNSLIMSKKLFEIIPEDFFEPTSVVKASCRGDDPHVILPDAPFVKSEGPACSSSR